jgi:Mrp family chromosome partitioning ATPase
MESPNLINRLAEEILVDHARKKNQVYLITSALDREGVTHVSTLLADSLRRMSPGKIFLMTIPKQELGQPEFGVPAEMHRAEFFEELKATYDVILIDAGGLLNRGRAVPFLAECNACILVTRAAKTRRGQVKETLNMLKRYNIPVIGSVLNAVEHVIPQVLYKRL